MKEEKVQMKMKSRMNTFSKHGDFDGGVVEDVVHLPPHV
jgi:hypothetical protein